MVSKFVRVKDVRWRGVRVKSGRWREEGENWIGQFHW
jgi:hypothetical protein